MGLVVRVGVLSWADAVVCVSISGWAIRDSLAKFTCSHRTSGQQATAQVALLQLSLLTLQIPKSQFERRCGRWIPDLAFLRNHAWGESGEAEGGKARFKKAR